MEQEKHKWSYTHRDTPNGEEFIRVCDICDITEVGRITNIDPTTVTYSNSKDYHKYHYPSC
jgi:hypothetical protein